MRWTRIFHAMCGMTLSLLEAKERQSWRGSFVGAAATTPSTGLPGAILPSSSRGGGVSGSIGDGGGDGGGGGGGESGSGSGSGDGGGSGIGRVQEDNPTGRMENPFVGVSPIESDELESSSDFEDVALTDLNLPYYANSNSPNGGGGGSGGGVGSRIKMSPPATSRVEQSTEGRSEETHYKSFDGENEEEEEEEEEEDDDDDDDEEEEYEEEEEEEEDEEEDEEENFNEEGDTDYEEEQQDGEYKAVGSSDASDGADDLNFSEYGGNFEEEMLVGKDEESDPSQIEIETFNKSERDDEELDRVQPPHRPSHRHGPQTKPQTQPKPQPKPQTQPQTKPQTRWNENHDEHDMHDMDNKHKNHEDSGTTVHSSDEHYDGIQSQPLQTLRKLQHMLDATDYIIKSPRATLKTSSMLLSPYRSPPKIPQTRRAPLNHHVRPSPLELHAGDTSTLTRTDQDHHHHHIHDQDQDQYQYQNGPIASESELFSDPNSHGKKRQQQQQQPPRNQQQSQQQQQQQKPQQQQTQQQQTQHQQQQQTQHQQKQQKQQQQQQQKQQQHERLWTSKDRTKYKKQQEMVRRAQEERRRLEQQIYQHSGSAAAPPSSDDEATSDADDGLGFTLPNLPIYMSDAEGLTDDGVDIDTQGAAYSSNPPPPPHTQHNPYHHQHQSAQTQQNQHQHQPPPQQYQQPTQQQTQPQPQQGVAQTASYPPYPYAMPPPNDPRGPYNGGYPNYPPPLAQYPPPYGPTAYSPQQYGSVWNGANLPYHPGMPPYPYRQPAPQRQFQPNLSPVKRNPAPKTTRPSARQNGATAGSVAVAPPPSTTKQHEQQKNHDGRQEATMAVQYPPMIPAHVDPAMMGVSNEFSVATSLAEASSNLTFDSIQKLAILLVMIVSLSYAAVSPRNLSLPDYNARFSENLRIVALVLIAPILNFIMVFDGRFNDLNEVIHTFYTAFTVGYGLAFVLEVVMTTFIRLGVFAWWEPDVFQLTPRIPSLVLPWVLRENNYRPKRITLFLADFITSCVACPIVEEYCKLKIVELCVNLPRNFRIVQRKPTKKNRNRRQAEPVSRTPGELEVTNINAYITHMLAASLGIKLCDSVRRILMYTKVTQPNKSFYAIVRGLFPIHELCGTVTALRLAQRDILGVTMPLWKILFPSVVIHGMANFRGMKPVFKWNSATPWSEMQLSPLNVADDSTLTQLASKGFTKLMWLVVLGRVLGFCIKNYYMITRQAIKRATTYAGKHAAFSAELAATEMLKQKKAPTTTANKDQNAAVASATENNSSNNKKRP